MIRKTLLIFALALMSVLTTDCKNSKKTTESTQAERSAERTKKNPYDGMVGEINTTTKIESKTTEPESQKSKESDVEKHKPNYPDSLFFRLDRTPCFGECPVYTVNIYSSGWAHMVGRDFFDYKGEFTTRFSESELIQIEKVAMQYGYEKYDHVYDAAVSDLPSTTTIIQSESLHHWVYNRINAPRELRNFELEMETMIKDKHWKPFEKGTN